MKKYFLVFLIIFGYFSAFFAFVKTEEDLPLNNLGENIILENKEEYLHYSYFNKEELYDNIGYGSYIKEVSGKKIHGGIVSHHLFAFKDISNFFFNLKENAPKTIVIVGPNHEERGVADILITEHNYKTPWGDVLIDRDGAEKLLSTGLVSYDRDAFSGEHSISALVSYIKFFMPDTKILPIIIKSRAKEAELDRLSFEISRVIGDDDVVLASVDFSHYLNRFASQFHDDKSVSSIKNFNFETLKKLEVDSPNSLRVLLKFLEIRSARALAYYKNTSSVAYSGIADYENNTSYLFAFFTDGKLKTDENVSILSFGDVMFDRGVRSVMDKGIDVLGNLKGEEGKFLKGYDFGILNLEGPITTSEVGQDKIYNFKFDPIVTDILSQNNFNLVNLANNHIYDYYSKGVEDTFHHLKTAGVEHFGGMKLEDSYTIKSVGDKKIAFVGIDETTRPIKLDNFYPLLQKLKSENDFVFVNIHWGYEYDKLPSKFQEDIGHSLIDNGADVVIGHHPHVVQSVEVYKNGVIFYSLGNFIFDQLLPDTKIGLGVGTILEKNKKTFYLFPLNIVGFRPKLMEYSEAERFCEDFLKEMKDTDVCSFTVSF